MRLRELVQVAKVTELAGTALDSHPGQPFSGPSAPAADGWAWESPTGVWSGDSSSDFALRYAAFWSKSICSFPESLNVNQVPPLQGLGTRWGAQVWLLGKLHWRIIRVIGGQVLCGVDRGGATVLA